MSQRENVKEKNLFIEPNENEDTHVKNMQAVTKAAVPKKVISSTKYLP